MNSELKAYIEGELRKGTSKEVIKAALAQAGWKPEDIESAFAESVSAPAYPTASIPQQSVSFGPSTNLGVMGKLADISAYVFIVAVIVLGGLSILAVWDVVGGDVIIKSFQSLGILVVVTVLVLVAEKYLDKSNLDSGISQNVATFKLVRNISLVVFIISIALLAFLGLLSVWEVLSADVMQRSLATMAIIAFSTFIIVLVSLSREGSDLLKKKRGYSIGGVIGFLFLMWILFGFLSTFW